MRKFKLLLAAGLSVFLFSQNVKSQGVTLACTGDISAELSWDMDGADLIVSADNETEAKEKLQKIVLQNLDGIAKCAICPKPNGKPCKMEFVQWVGTAPNPTKVGNKRYQFNAQTLTFKVKCLECDMTMVSADITDPLNGTLASCGGDAQYVSLYIPGINIFNLNGDIMTFDEAQERWRNMIIMDNGNFIEGSDPWGCMVSTCGDLGGCNLQILADSDPIPTAETSEETPGVWHFAPTTYNLVYLCSACETGEGGGNGEGEGGDAGNGLGKNGRVKTSNLIGHHADEVVQQVYPNPANETLNIVLSSADEQASVTITDMTGKLIHSQNVNMTAGQRTLISLSLSDYASGIYHLNVKTGTRQSYREFIVK